MRYNLRVRQVITILLIFFITFSQLPAQELGAFEDSLEGGSESEGADEAPDEEEESEEDIWDDDEVTFSGILMELFVRLAWYAVIYGGAYSNDRMSAVSGELNEDDFLVRPRSAGEPLIPLFRSDTSLGILNTELYCADQRFELGYGAVGLSGRYSLFFETDRPAGLHLWETYLHYRMSLGNTLEMSPGFGGFGMTGEGEYNGFSMSFPVKIFVPGLFSAETFTAFNFYPNDVLALDFDAALLLDLGFIHPKAGYRRYSTETDSLNVFYVGCAVVY